jgi:phage shock protein PspC (stress-responsive transcriptional regulator)
LIDMQESLRDKLAAAGFVRVREGRVLGGVIAGLSRRYNLTPAGGRLLFVLALMILPGSQLIVYPLLWVLMPMASEPPRTLTLTPGRT